MQYASWVKTEGWSWARAAAEIGVANATAARRLAFGTLPKPPLVRRIYLRSEGRVTPNDWYDLPALPASADSQPADSREAA